MRYIMHTPPPSRFHPEHLRMMRIAASKRRDVAGGASGFPEATGPYGRTDEPARMQNATNSSTLASSERQV